MSSVIEELAKEKGWDFDIKVTESKLISLDLSYNRIDMDDIETLIDMLNATEDISSLILSGNIIGFKELKSIAYFLRRSNLTHLDLSHNTITDRDVEAIVDILRDSKISSLVLCGNYIGIRGVKLIANVLKSSNLTLLDLSFNEFDTSAMKFLKAALPDCKLSTLNLCCNNIGGGIKYLSNILSICNLTSLNLSSCSINNLDMELIGKNLRESKLKCLSLSWNDVEEYAIIEFLHMLPKSSLTSLDLSHTNNITIKTI